MGLWRGVAGLIAVLVGFSPALAQSDTEPPVLTSFDFTPQSVDVTGGPEAVSCEISLIDSPAGVAVTSVYFESPSGQTEGCGHSTPTSGDLHNGTWTCDAWIAQYAEEGTWRVSEIQANDKVGNRRVYYTGELEALGFPTELYVANDNSDTQPPVLTNFDFTPQSVDVTGGPAAVTCEMSLVDSPAGVAVTSVYFESPSGQTEGCGRSAPTSGDLHDGTWTCDAWIAQYAEEGTWRVSEIQANDKVGNRRVYYTGELEALGFPTELQVVDLSDDVEPPVLTSFDFTPQSVDVTGGPEAVSCEISLIDSPAGVAVTSVYFESPSGQTEGCGRSAPTSGDLHDGTWTCDAWIAQYAEEGTWRVSEIQANDKVGNRRVYYTGDLEALGYATLLSVGFMPGPPQTIIFAPRNGKRVRGNSVTIRADLVQGDPVEVSPTLGVRFDYRALPFGEYAPVPARNPNHANPDTRYPYFIHWDLSEVPDGDFELRAVAHDLAGTPDPVPETITITIDHADPADVEEYVNAEGRQESQTAVDSVSENKIASGDHTDASTATELTLPPDSLLYTTDTAKLVYPDPADEEGQLEQVEQSIDAFVDLSLISGQTDLEAGMTGDLNISYADANQDGVIDGTSIREEDLELRHLDTGTNSYLAVPSIVLTEHNMVHAEPGSLGEFALAGPLLPKMWIESDKETLTWDAVSTATSYVVYRGLLSTLVDADDDGFPDGGFGDCMSHLDSDPTDLLFVDPDDPGGGDGFLYVVGYVGPSGPAGLGNTSSGLRREPALVCP